MLQKISSNFVDLSHLHQHRSARCRYDIRHADKKNTPQYYGIARRRQRSVPTDLDEFEQGLEALHLEAAGVLSVHVAKNFYQLTAVSNREAFNLRLARGDTARRRARRRDPAGAASCRRRLSRQRETATTAVLVLPPPHHQFARHRRHYRPERTKCPSLYA